MNNLHIPIKISIFSVVAAVALSGFVYPIAYRAGQKVTERFFDTIDS